MAVKYYTALAPITRQRDRITIGSTSAGTVHSATINGQTVSYTAITGDTTTTAAAGLLAAMRASSAGEWRQCTPSADTNLVDVLGPDDGGPFTMTAANGTQSTVTAGTGPRHTDNVLNYTGGALPTSTVDELVIADVEHGPQYALTALAAIVLTNFTRRASHTGRIGLPVVNSGGYREYRATELSVNCSGAVRIETNDTDAAEQIKLVGITNFPTSIVVTGTEAGELGEEVVELRTMTSVPVSISNSSVAVAKRVGQVCALGALTCLNSTCSHGELATAAAVKISGGNALIKGNFATLAVDRDASVEASQAAASTGAGITVDGGTVVWNSSGDPIAVNVGSDGTFDLSNCPVAIPSTNITLNEGASYLDPEAKNTMPYNVVLTRTDLAGVTLDVGTARTLAVS